MRSYERNGVTVDQCTDCRGLFLDRGELEHLIDAESRFNGGPAAPPAPSYPTPSHPTPGYSTPGPPAPGYPNAPPARPPPRRPPLADPSPTAPTAPPYLGKGKKSSSKKGKKSFIDGLFG